MLGNYHPFRLGQMIKLAEKQWSDIHEKGYEIARRRGVRSEDQVNEVIADLIHQEFSTMPAEENHRRADEFDALRSAHVMFEASGKNIFNVVKLADLFSQTDVSDVNFSEIEIGYLASYFFFGKEAGLYVDVERSAWIEGAYVMQASKRNDNSFAGGVALFVCNNPTWPQPSNITIAGLLRDVSTVARVMLPGDKTVGQALDDKWVIGDETLTAASGLLERALALLVNTMMYMNSVDPDIEEGYDDDAPADWVKKARQGSPKAYRELDRKGYSRVKFFGRSLKTETIYDETGRVISKHTRKGHWRRAKVGPGRGSIKITWVRPTTVNRESDAPFKPRIYDVDPPADDAGR